ncbi:MAG TPA: FHA domain-containing protein [Candidatus Acidoferrales bacterium]|nr:FHA domain-containing protein [Candidatus Acidoferrales bacterium]
MIAPTAPGSLPPAEPPPPPGAHEATSVMPAFQPPAPLAGDVDETMVLGAPKAPTEVQAELTIETGPDAGHSVRVGAGAVRVGRSPDNDLILRDPATSGHHARLERRGAQFWIVDLGSTNGTLVNGEPVQEKELKHDDRVTIGQNAVKFSLG